MIIAKDLVNIQQNIGNILLHLSFYHLSREYIYHLSREYGMLDKLLAIDYFLI